MRRSKFQIYIKLLATMNGREPMKITHLAQKVNLNASVTRDFIDFMLAQGLIEERSISKKRRGYSITGRGEKILEYVNIVLRVTPQELWNGQYVRQRK